MSPPIRCATTNSGFNSKVTVHMPSRPWNTTSSTSTSGSRRRLRGIAPVRPGAGRDREDQQTEPGREIAVQHLLERLARLERPFGIRAVRVLRILERLADRQVPVTAGPVRAAETGVTQAHPGAQHDDAQREQRAGKTQTMEQSGSHEACLFSRCVKVAAIV